MSRANGETSEVVTSLLFEEELTEPEKALIQALITTANTKVTPVDADTLGIQDSEESGTKKRLTFANLWVWITAKIATMTRTRLTVGSSRNLADSDHNCILEVTAAVTLTNPGTLAAGFECEVVQMTANQATFVTTQSRFALNKTGGQYAVASLRRMSDGTVILAGDLA